MEGLEFTCCFTGHRRIPKENIEAVYGELLRVMEILVRSGVTCFRAGGALGFDTLAALAVLDKKRELPTLRLELYLPCADQMKYYDEQELATYEYIKSHADKVVVLHERYTRGCMHERNRLMVDGSDYCVAYCTEQTGGTAYTVEYAKKRGVKLIDLELYIKNNGCQN